MYQLLDVQKLSDNSLVLFHDRDIDVPFASIAVAKLNYDQFKNLAISNPKQLAIEDTPVKFEDILPLIVDGKGIDVELKIYDNSECCNTSLVNMHDYCCRVHQLVKRFAIKNVIYTSFDITLCILMRCIQASNHILYVIPEDLANIKEVIGCIKKFRLNGIVMKASQGLNFGKYLKEVKQENNLIYMTYNQPHETELILKQFEYGIDGVIVDDPRNYQWLINESL